MASEKVAAGSAGEGISTHLLMNLEYLLLGQVMPLYGEFPPALALKRLTKIKTSVPIGAWKCNFQPFGKMTDQAKDRQTRRPWGLIGEVTLPIIINDDNHVTQFSNSTPLWMKRRFRNIFIAHPKYFDLDINNYAIQK